MQLSASVFFTAARNGACFGAADINGTFVEVEFTAVGIPLPKDSDTLCLEEEQQPTGHDAFLRLFMRFEGIYAHTWRRFCRQEKASTT